MIYSVCLLFEFALEDDITNLMGQFSETMNWVPIVPVSVKAQCKKFS